MRTDFLIEKATAIETHSLRVKGNKHGDIGWHDARETVARYTDYCKDQEYIDGVFSKYDSNDDGWLDREDLLQLLGAMAPIECTDSVDETDVAYILEQCDAE